MNWWEGGEDTFNKINEKGGLEGEKRKHAQGANIARPGGLQRGRGRTVAVHKGATFGVGGRENVKRKELANKKFGRARRMKKRRIPRLSVREKHAKKIGLEKEQGRGVDKRGPLRVSAEGRKGRSGYQ